MSNQHDSTSKGWVIIITSIIGVIGTITVAYFAFRGAIFPAQLEIEATQTAQSILSTQMANNIWITQTAQSIDATKLAENIIATQSSISTNSTLSAIQNPTQTPYPTYTPPPTSTSATFQCSSPLKLYWNPTNGDNFTTATDKGEQDALSAGYQFARIEGYVFSTVQVGTVPLKLYWNPTNGDNFTTATDKGEQDALSAGYQFARIEGYVCLLPTP